MTAGPAGVPGRSAPLRDAATVVVLRDGPDGHGPLEVLLLWRPPAAGFAPGATVFPGGGVDPDDHDPAWGRDADGVASLDPRAPQPLAIAAIRECLEETGLLLAVDAAGRPPTPQAVERVAAAVLGPRPAASGGLRWALRASGLRADLGRLVFAAHWITPAGLPLRYDTRFFLARAPDGQAAHIPPTGELRGHAWATPAAALDQGRAGTWQLLPPTRAVLAWVARQPTVAAALAAARAAAVATVEPRLDEVTPERVPGLDPAVLRGVHGG